jgi:hypothetical protein
LVTTNSQLGSRVNDGCNKVGKFDELETEKRLAKQLLGYIETDVR